MRFSPGAQLLQPPAAAPIALASWDGATMLQSLLDAGLGGYDDFALATPSQYVAAVPEVAAKPVPPVLPVPLMDDEINRALPPLATLQRSDTLWGEVLSYLDTVTDHQAPSGSNRRFRSTRPRPRRRSAPSRSWSWPPCASWTPEACYAATASQFGAITGSASTPSPPTAASSVCRARCVWSSCRSTTRTTSTLAAAGCCRPWARSSGGPQ